VLGTVFIDRYRALASDLRGAAPVAEGADPESKTEDATPRKLEEARKKGDVAKSPDVASALSV
jgi:hypothetical protein